jgi:hypothetical protein
LFGEGSTIAEVNGPGNTVVIPATTGRQLPGEALFRVIVNLALM